MGQVLFSLCTYEPDLSHPDHTHEHPGLFVLLKGDHREVRPGGSFCQEPLSAVWHGTGTLHATAVGPGGMKGLNISFSRDWFKEYEIDEKDLSRLPFHASPLVQVECLRIVQALGQDPGFLEMGAMDLLQFCYNETHWINSPEWLTAVRERLHYEFEAPPRTSDLADAASVHPVYLARAFRHKFGCTMSAYVQMRRVHTVARQLAGGMASGEAATQSGFADQSHMIRQFKRWVGTTPRAFQDAMASSVV